MLARVRSWLRRREQTRRRLIFTFTVAGRRHAVDPIVVFRGLEAHGTENWQSLVQLVAHLSKPIDPSIVLSPADMANRTKRYFEAVKTLAEMVRKAFDLQPLAADGSGVTEEEATGVLADFLEYTGGLAEEARPFPN